MRRTLRWLPAAAALCAAALTAGCASSSAPAPAAKSSPPPRPPCVGTLGIEAGPITRAARKKLGLSDNARGALVTEVLPNGPAAAAGILAGDVVVKIGATDIVTDCEFDAAAFNRSSCEPVSVSVRRAGAGVEATLTPVDQSPFLEKACQSGNADACFREGWLLWSRRGEGPKVERALEIFTAACKAGSAQACAYEAQQLMDTPDRAAASLAAADRSCELGNGGGCATLAFLYATGKFVKKDDRRAATLYTKACDLGDPQGCYNVGVMADDARPGPRDLARAAAKYEEACSLGSATGCTNLGSLYERGQGVKMDKLKAVALYQHGCDGSSCQRSNLTGCVNVGRAYRDGIGVEKDEARAAGIFHEACDRRLDPDDVHAAENGARACSLLGALYVAGGGIPKDIAKGQELSELGCERGDSFGCFNAYVGATDPAEAARFLDLACKGGDAEGCFELGVAYEKGTGVAVDRKQSTALYRKACQMGFAKACAKKKG